MARHYLQCLSAAGMVVKPRFVSFGWARAELDIAVPVPLFIDFVAQADEVFVYLTHLSEDGKDLNKISVGQLFPENAAQLATEIDKEVENYERRSTAQAV